MKTKLKKVLRWEWRRGGWGKRKYEAGRHRHTGDTPSAEASVGPRDSFEAGATRTDLPIWTDFIRVV